MIGGADQVEREAVSLILAGRWAALATVGKNGPLASMVAYAPEAQLEGVLMFLSGLSAHTRNLAADRRAALAISAPDPGEGDPQTLARISLEGTVSRVDRSSAGFPDAWASYSARFPAAASRLGLADFDLFRLTIERARYVGGFARARTISAERLQAATRSL